MINEKNLFAKLMKGEVAETKIEDLTVDNLKALSKAASSKKSRANDEAEFNQAAYIQGLVKAQLDKLENKTTAAEWKIKPVEELTIDDVNKAIKQAQWYKHTYGPKAQAQWKAIIVAGKDHPMYAKAQKNLEKAAVEYPKSLQDEEHWIQVKDAQFPDVQVAKKENAQVKAIRAQIEALRSKHKLNATDKAVLATLEALIK